MKTNREKLEGLVWKHTHKDFRSNLNGVRMVLSFGRSDGCSCLLSLDGFTTAELIAKLPASVVDANEELLIACVEVEP